MAIKRILMIGNEVLRRRSDEVLEMTPLPHEEGTPLFKYKLVHGFKVERPNTEG